MLPSNWSKDLREASPRQPAERRLRVSAGTDVDTRVVRNCSSCAPRHDARRASRGERPSTMDVACADSCCSKAAIANHAPISENSTDQPFVNPRTGTHAGVPRGAAAGVPHRCNLARLDRHDRHRRQGGSRPRTQPSCAATVRLGQSAADGGVWRLVDRRCVALGALTEGVRHLCHAAMPTNFIFSASPSFA